MTRTVLRSTVVALAAAALTAPAALAHTDPPSLLAKPAAPALRRGLHPANASRLATRPVLDRNPADGNPAQPSRPSSPPVTVSVASAEKGIDWATIAIGIGGSLLGVGAIALITTRMRRPHARISA
jgi:hypothetical protein